MTSAPLWPNMYVFLIGHPGTGKSRVAMAARGFLAEIPEFHIAPTSMRMASLVDCLRDAKRTIIDLPNPAREYNSMILMVDEWGAFMHTYDDELMAGLTTFYDVNIPYSQRRRSKDIKISIENPQLSILAGSTPTNLVKFMPEIAWDQGFTSRILLIFSDERPSPEGDEFNIPFQDHPKDMIHDLKAISALTGEFKISDEYRQAVSNWRKLGQGPVPRHPRLVHYCSRRRSHLHKLAMVASVDRGDSLAITTDDFNRAMGWLLEAECFMPDIFQAGSVGADAKVMEEIHHYIMIQCSEKTPTIPEHLIVNFARERVPAHSVMRVLEIMTRSGMISVASVDKLGIRTFKPGSIH